MICENKERTRAEPKQPGEDEFTFYDSAGGEAYDTYRALLNGWIADYPESERAELVARLFGGLATRTRQERLAIPSELMRSAIECDPAGAASIEEYRRELLGMRRAGAGSRSTTRAIWSSRTAPDRARFERWPNSMRD
jgi:hypothetical protein